MVYEQDLTLDGFGDRANPAMVELSRLALGWPKKTLAEQVGVSPAHVTRVENGTLALQGETLTAYATALGSPEELLCVSYARSRPEGIHFRSQASVAEWKRDRVLAQADLTAMRLGRVLSHADIEPSLSLPVLDPVDFAEVHGEIVVAQMLRHFWRIAGPVPDLTALMEAAGIFIVAVGFPGRDVDAVTLRSNGFHPHLVYINRELPPDRYRMTLAHELGHIVMDENALVPPTELEERATSFAAEFLAPYELIADALTRIAPTRLYEVSELRLRWGLSASSFVYRSRQHGHLSDYQYKSMYRRLSETGELQGDRPGVRHETPKLAGRLLLGLSGAGFTDEDLKEATFLSKDAQAALFGAVDRAPSSARRSRLRLV